MDYVGLMVLLELMEILGHKGQWDSEDLRDQGEIQEQQEILDLWAHKEQKVLRGLRESEDLQVIVTLIAKFVYLMLCKANCM